MPKHTTTTNTVSTFMRELWAAEAEHPVFAGSLNNIKLFVSVENRKSAKPIKAAQKRKLTTARPPK